MRVGDEECGRDGERGDREDGGREPSLGDRQHDEPDGKRADGRPRVRVEETDVEKDPE